MAPTVNGTAPTRRGFIGGSAAAMIAAGAIKAIPAFAEDPSVPGQWDPTLPESWDKTCECLVIGCGIAGACATVEAYDLGLNVVCVEANNDIKDCQCSRSGGFFCGCNTSLQEAEDIEDSVELFVEDIIRDGERFNDRELVTRWAEMSGETIDWLWDLGVELVPQVIDARVAAGSNAHSVARDYKSEPTGDGYGWMLGLENAIAERGIDLMMETRATRLYRNPEGRVVGAQVTCADGSEMNIEATKGVIMAAGSYGRNLESWGRYNPEMAYIKDHADDIAFNLPKTAVGDAIIMLENVNAHMLPTLMNSRLSALKISEDGETAPTLVPFNWPGGLIYTNLNGERFMDESSFSKFYTDMPYLTQPGISMIMIFDDETRQTPDGQQHAQRGIDAVAETGYEGTVYSADTLEDLAAYYGLDPEALVASVEDFNARVDQAVDGVCEEPDAFGRTKFERKIATPPFWGFKLCMVVCSAKGGAKINVDGQVLDNNDEVIPGLYAAGESAMFQFQGSGHEHVAGGPNSAAACYGRVCARSIAANE